MTSIIDGSKPFSPDQIAEAKKAVIPAGVIGVFNRLIAKHYSEGSAEIGQKEIVAAICATMECERGKVFAEKWLDVEDLFRAEGWKVVYDKPAYNESYEATFTFSRGAT